MRFDARTQCGKLSKKLTKKYLIMMRISDPVSMALNSSDSSNDEKNNLDQTLPRSAFSSRSVFGIPCRALHCSRMMAASADVFSWSRRQRWSLSWSASCVRSVEQWIWISLRRINNFCSSSSGPEILKCRGQSSVDRKSGHLNIRRKNMKSNLDIC